MTEATEAPTGGADSPPSAAFASIGRVASVRKLVSRNLDGRVANRDNRLRQADEYMSQAARDPYESGLPIGEAGGACKQKCKQAARKSTEIGRTRDGENRANKAEAQLSRTPPKSQQALLIPRSQVRILPGPLCYCRRRDRAHGEFRSEGWEASTPVTS